MKTLTIRNKFQANATLVANDFIDNYMIQANGEFVKVYLFLLRHLDDSCSALTISTIADCLNNTENDILRAFKYWESKGLLRLECDAQNKICAIELVQIPSVPSYDTAGGSQTVPDPQNTLTASASAVRTASADSDLTARAHIPGSKAIPLDSFKAQKELKSLLFIAEQYLGKTLSRTDVDAITYFYNSLHMSADLVEYLIESCVENGHKSIHYIQKVALSWADRGITTKEQAKQEAKSYNRNCYTVLNAFGIKNRGPAASELTYIQKWTDTFGFSLDIIEEACSRTISATHQPSFEYADTILTRWHNSQVHHLKDIAVLDTEYQKQKTSASSSAPKTRPVTKNMNNFERRAYDMDSLEEQLLNSN